MPQEPTDSDIPTYDPPAPPFPIAEAALWTKSEAHEFFAWTVENRERRIDELRRLAGEEEESCGLDLSPDSLLCLAEFLQRHVRTRLLRPDERRDVRDALTTEIPAAAVEPVLRLVGDWALHDETDRLCLDIGLYFGEVMRAAHPQLLWEPWLRRTVEMNRPVLMGFTRDPLDPFWRREDCRVASR